MKKIIPEVLIFTENMQTCKAFITQRRILRNIKELTFDQMLVIAPFRYNGKPYEALVNQEDRNQTAKEKLAYYILKMPDELLIKFGKQIKENNLKTFKNLLNYKTTITKIKEGEWKQV